MRYLACLLLCGCLILTRASPVPAVIIKGGDGTGNTTAPADDPGWSYVGQIINSSGVYLGNGWVLTAAHVGAGSTVTFGSTSYPAVPGSWHRLHNPNNSSQVVDLGLFRLEENPVGLTDLLISSVAPATGSQVLGVGYGRNRAVTATWWNGIWQEQTPSEVYAGFHWASGNSKRWGTNNISGTTEADYGYGLTSLLTTNFSQSGGSNEMQAAQYDSGGGLFYKSNGSWELTGIMLAVGNYSGQPQDTSVYGNVTYSADLSQYRSEIMTIIPEPGSLALLLTGGIVAWLAWRSRRRWL